MKAITTAFVSIGSTLATRQSNRENTFPPASVMVFPAPSYIESRFSRIFRISGT
jgi:hypothetical protein